MRIYCKFLTYFNNSGRRSSASTAGYYVPSSLISPLHFFGLMRPPQDRKIVYFSLRTLKFAYTSTNSSKFGGKPLL